jgi:hypothetical protein
MSCTGDPSMQAVQRNRPPSAWQADSVGDLGDGPDRRELVVVAWDEKDMSVVLPGVNGERHRHAREYDDIF